MTSRTYPIGFLFSVTGTYGTLGRTMQNGAQMACDEINASDVGIRFEPMAIDPGSQLSAYAPAVHQMLDSGVRHVIGCYTSSSRKDIIPIFEKRDALLWYPSHYEGFESSGNVIYTGASPNHHLSPLVDYLVESFGRRAFCIGSNYIWGWESNRVLRENLVDRGGVVLAERYFSVGDTDFDDVIEAIFEAEPDFIFNALIGQSACFFFRNFREACARYGIDQRSRFPIASCNLSEPELIEIGPGAMDGHISSSVYFSTVQTPQNETFLAGYANRYPDGPIVAVEAEAAYVATKLLAEALIEAGSDDIQHVRKAVAGKSIDAPQGRVSIDPETMHAYLTPRIGLSREDGQFDIVVEAKQPIRPDPYMVHSTQSTEAVFQRPKLRIV